MDKLSIVNEWLTRSLWIEGIGQHKKLTGVSIKVQPTGLLMILKAISPEGPVIAFVGGSSLEDIMRKVKATIADGGVRWREDRFAFDNLVKNG